MRQPIVEIDSLSTRFGRTTIHRNIDLAIYPAEVFAIAGASGCGKSTLLRQIVMLTPYQSGGIRVFGEDLARVSEARAARLRRRWAMMFQGGALFSALTVAENVAMPMKEHTDLSAEDIRELAFLKIGLAGLPADAAHKYPRELSGGLRKRAALARALALDPELLLLDEPSAGLDPLAASGLDELVLSLNESLKLTIIIVTHDLDLLWRTADRVAVLGEGRVVGLGTMQALSNATHPLVREYFHGPRGRPTGERAWNRE